MTLDELERYDPDVVDECGDRAVVVGGSVAGLLAARVLADAFDEVVVLERDVLPEDASQRDGVPQATQIHALLEAGRATVEDLCPGYCESLLAAGGVLLDGASQFRFYGHDEYLADGPRRMPFYAATRPLFERVLREHVTRLPAVTVRGGTRVTDYLLDDTGTTLAGVERREGTAEADRLPADVVVDATGRASRTPRWLATNGFAEPPVVDVPIDVGYATVAVERPPEERATTLAMASAPRTRGEAVFPVEDGTWLVNVHGVAGDHPPTDLEGVREFAASLPTNAAATALDERSPVGDVHAYRFPSSRRRRYEALDADALPDGLLVVGDAIASFNPIYGQGMSVSALEALALHHALASGGSRALSARFFERASPVVDHAWEMAIGADASFAPGDTTVPPHVRAFTAYFDHVMRAAQEDGHLREALMRVIAMQDPPTALVHPGVVRRVLAVAVGNARARRSTTGSDLRRLAAALGSRFG
ncbi:NAD(P)/FAD-dependent oxidoreductase [Halorubellus salinus]|uniref:NAD(P)/FAD-dependent oxidoreductase n=1 Tax=Halorubellus salinus TaxID=755309 RepID=UPI001D062BCC|nr:FAD-dependent monooxygenase [Halorubellus salinus]